MTNGTRLADAGARNAELEAELQRVRAQLADSVARNAELESQLGTEKTQFALAERSARVGYWRRTLSDDHVTWSPGMYALFGMNPDQPIPTAEEFFLTVDEETRRLYPEMYRTAIRNCSSYSHRVRVRFPDGSTRVFDNIGNVEVGPDGKAIAVVGATHDVTLQVAMEAERNNAQELHRITMEAASDIILLYDAQGVPLYASAALERTLGWTIHELGQHLAHPADTAEATKLRESPPPGKPVVVTFRVRHADGRYVWLEGTFTTVRDSATNQVLYRVGVARDVSERKAQELITQKAREEAEAANRAKSVFLANMSHELRTPLNAIIGFTDVMRHEMFGPVDNAHYREYVSLIHNSGKHLLDLINDILDMSKIEAGKYTLDIEDMNLDETIDECVQTMSSLAAQGGVNLTVSSAVRGLTLSADRRAVKQIILNLLSNSIKFTRAGGHVNVTTSVEGDTVRIEIRDDGIGIAPEDLPRLGKPFEQVRDDPSLTKNGTGLGLAIVRGLAEKHGGRLTIDSPARQGTIATVEIPRVVAARKKAAA